jgi:exonuclease, DNA polymerase III, epsilon subunit family
MQNNLAFTYALNAELSETERIFKLSEAILNQDGSLAVTLIVDAADYDKFLDAALKEKVEKIVRSIVPASFDVAVVFKKTYAEEGYVLRLVSEFLYREAALVFGKIDKEQIKAEIGYDYVKVKITVPPYVYSYMENNKFSDKISDFLDSRLTGRAETLIISDSRIAGETTLRRARRPIEEGIKVIKAETVKNIVGAVSRLPKYISEVAAGESDSATICGKVSFLKRRQSKAGKDFFVFKLNDTTGDIDVKYFPKDAKAAGQFEEDVRDGAQIAAEGPVKLDSFTNGPALIIYRAALCIIDYGSINNRTVWSGENDDYLLIEPEPFSEEIQADLFSEPRALPKMLEGVNVIFDLETTGLAPTNSKIIEIAAVKMVGGAIKETFSTLINPGVPIPAETVKINNITDADVKNSPSFSDVVADFYKFTRGAVLVAHNAPFDISFLTYNARACSYNFDNDVIDTFQLAKDVLKLRRFSLEYLTKELGIELVGAHRALNDALATAELFRKLAYISEEKQKAIS